MDTYQNSFHQEWSQLSDPHVRALAWLLTSPDLLDKSAPVWWQQIGTLDIPNREKLRTWLFALNAHPSPLHEALKIHKFLRLGHYAEKLLAFYFSHEGLLYSHGLQVHSEKSETIGEFDFLLYAQGGLLHIELATKFYLFHRSLDASRPMTVFNYLGPNLNDNLGAKMRKILQQQLTLSQHECARKLVQSKVIAAKALIKGWLFYHSSDHSLMSVAGIAANHCMGFWWTIDEFEKLAIPYALKLDRLQWLAPAQVAPDEVMDRSMILEALHRHFLSDSTPVMVAIMKKNTSLMQEFCRGMVVPNDWVSRATQVLP
jgi:hypothetical protein